MGILILNFSLDHDLDLKDHISLMIYMSDLEVQDHIFCDL